MPEATDPGLWTARGPGPAAVDGLAGQRGRDDDRDHARARRARRSPRRPRRPSTSRSDRFAGQPPAARWSASTPARSGLARCATATSTWRSSAAATASSSSRLSARAVGADLLAGGDPPVDDLEQRLDRQRRAEQGGGGADPAAAPEVLQGVDVEQRRRAVGPRQRGAGRLLGRPAPRPARRRRRARRSRWPCPAGACRRCAPGSGASRAASWADS